ncbi:MAG: S8 family serine peptidase [Bacteroidota bacterium]
MNRFALLFLTLAAAVFATAQDAPKKYWIYFTSKENTALAKSSSPADAARAIGLSDRAILRRAKVSKQIITQEDLPISSSFISTLEQTGVTVQNQSRWFNAVTAFLTASQIAAIEQFPFVRSIEPVGTFTRTELPQTENHFSKSDAVTADPDSQLYGKSITHMRTINAIAVHKIGIKGRGVLVGMLDTGFRWKTHEAMQNMNVIAEYDFVQKDNNTANEGTDASNQDSHGTGTMSLVGAYKEGQLVSPAYNASFILGKTEYVPTETHVEEDNWAAAIEWMESSGVDVVSSSLGYNTFDSGVNYLWADMNGRTAIVSKAAVLAARRGVVVVNAMGNEGAGFNPPSITAPADADSIISVGAVTSAGFLAGFSSNGPTSDGRMKPDVVAHGVGTYWATTGGKSSYSGGSQGTSLATPLVAGAAAMILSAHPELTPIQVRDALRNTAANAAKPNNDIGWGNINAYQAVLYNGMVMSTDPEITFTKDSNYLVGMFVVSKSVIKKDSVRLYYTLNNGSTFIPVPMTLGEIVDTATNSGRYFATVPYSGITPRLYVRAVDTGNIPRTNPYKAPTELYDAKTGTTGVPKTNPVPSEFTLLQNYPNPFNPSTLISFDIPRTSITSLKVYDVLGKEVATLVNGETSFGRHTVQFNGAGLASGVYFYRLQSRDFVQTKRMLLIK